MQKALGSESALRSFRGQLANDLGPEVSVVNERVDTVKGLRVYSRLSRFEKFGGVIQVVWTLDKDDTIAGFYVQPQQQPAASPYLDYQTQAKLQLPFNGEWYVFWGEPVLAPGAGTVVTAINSLLDQVPGTMDAKNPPGNHVIVDMGNKEFALLAHLQQSSVVVNVGDEVAAGDTLGLCGNSGNTREPHIHFHIQDEPGFGNGNGKPAFFENYLSGGTLVERGEPKRGEFVKNAPHQ